MNSSLNGMLEIILVTYNRARYLDATLEKLRSSPLAGCKFTVIDNGSTDATPEICRKYAALYPDFHICRNRFNVGISGNYLRALETATSEYTWILCNDDNYDFSHFDEIVEAVTSRKYDIISVGVPNHSVLPRGTVIRAPELIRDRRYNFFYTGSFIPCTIFRTSLVAPEMVLKGYYNIHTIYSNLFFFVYAVKQNALVYVTRYDFIINRQENVGYRPLHLVAGWMMVAQEVMRDDKAIGKAMMHEMLGRYYYPQKIFQYTVFQRGFANRNTCHDAFRLAIESFKAGPNLGPQSPPVYRAHHLLPSCRQPPALEGRREVHREERGPENQTAREHRVRRQGRLPGINFPSGRTFGATHPVPRGNPALSR